MKKAILLTLLLAILIGLCACTSSEEATLAPDAELVQFCIGVFSTPQDDCVLEDQLEFFPDGTCSVSNYSWSVSGDVLNISISHPDGTKEIYGFSILPEEGIIRARFSENVLYYKYNG